MGNLVSSHPRPPRSRRRSSRSGAGSSHDRRRATAALTAPPAQVLLDALSAADGDGNGDAHHDYASFSRAFASLPPSAAALVCRQDPRLLHAAAASGDLCVLRAVLDRGANPALPSPALGAAPLHAASTPAAASLLVASGANAFVLDARGRTPADLAGRGMLAPGGIASASDAAADAAALVRALEGGAPFSGRAAIMCDGGGGGGGGAGSPSSSHYSSPYHSVRRRDRRPDEQQQRRQQQQQQWVEAWVVVSPVFESRPFGASPPRLALSAELRAYAVPPYAASAADTLGLAAAAPFLRVPLDGCRVEREAEDAAAAAAAGGGGTTMMATTARASAPAGVRLMVLPGDPRCLLPRRWRAEEEEGRGLFSSFGRGGGGRSGGDGGFFVLRMRPSVADEAAAAAVSSAPSPRAFTRLVALCRDRGLREAAAAAAGAGGLAAAAAAAASAADAATDAADAASPTAAAAAAAAAPTIPLPPPEVMAAAEARELLPDDEDEDEGGGGGGNRASQRCNSSKHGGRCVVCWAARASMAFAHGGTVHVCACARCARRLATSLCPSCPVCRAPVSQVLAVFYSEIE